jgi:hypothetical protein
LANPLKGQAFCDNITGGTLLENVTDITTGYFGLLCSSAPAFKCNHGYKGFFSPPFCAAKPGINKDDASRIVHDRAYNQVRKLSVWSVVTLFYSLFFYCAFVLVLPMFWKALKVGLDE